MNDKIAQYLSNHDIDQKNVLRIVKKEREVRIFHFDYPRYFIKVYLKDEEEKDEEEKEIEFEHELPRDLVFLELTRNKD